MHLPISSILFIKNNTYKLWSGLLKRKISHHWIHRVRENIIRWGGGGRRTRSFTHTSDAPKATAAMPARPPITPGKPCRL